MTREQKLALIVGFALVLIVGVLVSDHLSLAQKQVAGDEAGLAEALDPEDRTPGLGRDLSGLALADSGRLDERGARPIDENYYTPEPTATQTFQTDQEEQPTLAGRTRRALADGAEQVGSLLKDSQNQNLPAAQTDTLVMRSNRNTDEPAEATRDERASDSRAEPEGPRPQPGRVYPTHTVRKGESLWTIAERYYADGRLYTKLAAFNEGRTGAEGTVYVGATILVPTREVLLGGETAPRTQPAKGGGRAEPVTPTESAKTYTVASGDTLSEISQELLGTSKRWREILELNGDVLEDAESLRVGMTLKIPAR